MKSKKIYYCCCNLYLILDILKISTNDDEKNILREINYC